MTERRVQMTAEQADKWQADANQYVAEEDVDAFGARSSCEMLLCELQVPPLLLHTNACTIAAIAVLRKRMLSCSFITARCVIVTTRLLNSTGAHAGAARGQDDSSHERRRSAAPCRSATDARRRRRRLVAPAGGCPLCRRLAGLTAGRHERLGCARGSAPRGHSAGRADS